MCKYETMPLIPNLSSISSSFLISGPAGVWVLSQCFGVIVNLENTRIVRCELQSTLINMKRERLPKQQQNKLAVKVVCGSVW